MRVVSVLPSATEMVCALGHGAELVGRSAECDFPSSVRNLPVVMGPRTLDADRPSGVIDERVRAARSRTESLYEIDTELLSRLRPDLVLTQDLCGVCSVTGPELEAACVRAGIHPRIVSLAPTRLHEVWSTVEVVGAALDDEAAGRRLAGSLAARASGPSRPEGPRIAVVEWLDPPILAGLWAPDMVVAAGGRPMAVRPGEPGRRTDWERIADERPDLVVVSPCSFSVSRTLRELDDLSLRRGLSGLAPPLGTYVADEAYFSRPGPRLADGVDLLRHLLAGDVWSPPMPVTPFATGEVLA